MKNKKFQKMNRLAGIVMILPALIEVNMTSAKDLKSLGVREGATKTINNNGVMQTIVLSALDQQRETVRKILKDTRRSTSKYITAKFASSDDGKKWVLGNALDLSADVSDAEITETYQNKGTDPKVSFDQFINSSPFRYVGIKVEASDNAIFNNEFTELVNDVDTNRPEPFNNVIDAGQNIIAEEKNVRFLNVAGVFNGCWGLTSTLDTGQWIKFSFNCVDIERSW